MFWVAQMLRVAFMATWYGKKAKRTGAPGVDSSALMRLELVKQNAQQFGMAWHRPANGSVKS
jgi:hypothetical protein